MKNNKPSLKKIGLLFVATLPVAGSAALAMSSMNHNIKDDSKNGSKSIGDLRTALETILSERTNKKWSKVELETKITEQKFDIEGGITVQELGSKRTTAKNGHEIITTWKFLGNAKVTNAFTYKGEIIIKHSRIESENNTESIVKIQKDLQQILNTEIKEWSQNDLKDKIDEKFGVGEITVELDKSTLSQRSANFEWKNSSWKFIGNGVKFKDQTTLKHQWINEIDGSQDIKKIESELTEVITKRKHNEWTVETLKSAISSAGIDVKEGFNVEKTISKTIETRLGNGGQQKTTWRITGNGSVDNNYKYNGSVLIEHIWNNLTDNSKHISYVKEKIVDVLNSKVNNAWNETDLLEALTSSEDAIDIKGGLTVSKLENSKTRSWQGSDHIDSWKIIGNGRADNDYKYKGELTLKHEWSDKLDTTRELSEIQQTIENIVSERKDSSWTQHELQKVIDDSDLDPIKGAIIVSKQETFNERLYENVSGSETWVFTARGTKFNNFKFKGSTTIKHTWNTTKDNTKSILEISLQLQDILNSKFKNVWTPEELEQEIVAKGIDLTGGIEVKEHNSEQKTRSWNGGWEKTSFTFTGKGAINNDWKYNESVTLTQEWDSSYDSSINIEKVSYALQRILDRRSLQSWTQEELQLAIDEAKIDPVGAGGIIVKQVLPEIETRSSTGEIDQDIWEFIGNGNEMNEFMWNNKVTLTHVWDNTVDTTKDINNNETIIELQNLLDSESYKYRPWTPQLLQEEIVKRDIDVASELGGITVEEIETVIETRLSEGSPKVTTWIFIGNGNSDNDGRYYGNVTLNHEWNDIKDTTQEINVIKDELTMLVNSTKYKNKKWIKDDLQDAVNAKWVGAGITVEEKLVPQTRSWDEKQQTTIWTFTGNGDVTNKYPYKNTVDIEHSWIELIPTTKNIEEIKSELENILNERKDNAWLQTELQTKVDEKYGIGEITVIDSDAVKAKNRSWGLENKIKNWIFKGIGENESITNPHLYYGETTLVHKWEQKADTSIDIEVIKNELNRLLTSDGHLNKEWSITDLQRAVDRKYGAGEIKVSRWISRNRNILRDASLSHSDKYTFTGQGNVNNDYKYKNSIDLRHTYYN
ncbi:hypothetical protein ESOMN_v1c02830 [Williamsoniiplasma somnilux]|uniref:Lipoprotein n=1 Tax=Williamsoniiplasma somnilux TaxID=215578 RepID=A0A2K8NXV6_9MOLU|nr:hypothetical protein [Williamsoniiplasma somnilux]ATZ18665.1 hypothetical protein ESOMN_v1c02830 [Williamsoniiplasma somnilux]